MKKRIMVGALVPVVASLGLWLGNGVASAAHSTHLAPVHRSEAGTAVDTDNIQSGDQTTPDTQSATVSTESEPQGGTESENQSEANGGTESAADTTAQVAACTAVGIDPSGSNVNYDDQTGTCTLDSGASNGGNVGNGNGNNSGGNSNG